MVRGVNELELDALQFLGLGWFRLADKTLQRIGQHKGSTPFKSTAHSPATS